MSSPAPAPQMQQQGLRVKRATLEDLARDWSPEDHAQLEPMLDRLARSRATEMSTPA